MNMETGEIDIMFWEVAGWVSRLNSGSNIDMSVLTTKPLHIVTHL